MENNKETLTDEQLETYNFWRESLRKQLGVSANLFLTFSVAIVAFLINFLFVEDVNIRISCRTNYLFKSAIDAFTFSIIVYVCFNLCRLYDYYKTQKLYRQGKTRKEVEENTKITGIVTWGLFVIQILLFLIGFCFIFKGFKIFLD